MIAILHTLVIQVCIVKYIAKPFNNNSFLMDLICKNKRSNFLLGLTTKKYVNQGKYECTFYHRQGFIFDYLCILSP